MEFYLVWRFFFYFPKCEMAIKFYPCLRKGIEKGGALSVAPTPAPANLLSLSETHSWDSDAP